jgi:hypothetical protein
VRRPLVVGLLRFHRSFAGDKRRASVVATAPIGLLSAPTFAPFSPGFLLEDRAGPPLPRLLSTVLLI